MWGKAQIVWRRWKLQLVVATTALIFVTVWCVFGTTSEMGERQEVSPSWKPSAEDVLQPFNSRGATIFMDKNGIIRIPSENILNTMELRDLEECYHRYVESIQTICKHQVHLGKVVDGGYDLCQDTTVAPTQPCLVYSFGVRDDFSFDEELTKLYGCEIHSFDPANGMADHKHSKNVYFHSMGLDGQDGIKKGNWKMRTLSSIKKELNHSDIRIMNIHPNCRLTTCPLNMMNEALLIKAALTGYVLFFLPQRNIEILKIDIEGGEWPVFPDMISSGALKGVKQLIMEFHSQVKKLVEGRITKQDYRKFLTYLRQLYDDGFRIFFFRRFHDINCIYTDEAHIERTGCHEMHFMRV